MIELVQNFLMNRGIAADTASIITRGTAFSLVILLGIATNFLAKRFVLPNLFNLISYTKTKWDDTFHNRKVFKNLSHLAPAIVIYSLVPFALHGADSWIYFIKQTLVIYMIGIGILVLDSILNAILDAFRTMEESRDVPLTSIFQFTKLIVYLVGGIFIISIILSKTPVYLLSGLGAITAILMLVFKDAILGFVAGIQLTANKMVARGDWVEIPKYGANGNVLEVTLTTVKVQNWDKTITTLPTYALINESFKNWRGMKESGVRRMKRAINIDLNSIGFCSDALTEKLMNVQYLTNYLRSKRIAIDEHNSSIDCLDTNPINCRRLTNIGTFRAYLDSYMANYPMINHGMTFLIRQLDPTEYGLPIEIYIFISDTDFAKYEEIQSDIFDHVLSIIPEFELRIFQSPSGGDFNIGQRRVH
ncbi:MAG: mechanosensitive ion channel [Candidatus Sabulitectum sp.]|nr:mechanosensitive ion channel [Candidatus Sabulitectum sp.]